MSTNAISENQLSSTFKMLPVKKILDARETNSKVSVSIHLIFVTVDLHRFCHYFSSVFQLEYLVELKNASSWYTVDCLFVRSIQNVRDI